VRSTYMTATRTPPITAEESSSQCAIYTSLPRDAQRYVDSVAAMGFDLLDVTRTVDKLGIDDKLVYEVLTCNLCFNELVASAFCQAEYRLTVID